MTAEAEIHVEATWNLRGSAIVRRRSEGDAERRPAAVGGEMPWSALASSMACAVILFLAGCLYFRKVEDGFADII